MIPDIARTAIAVGVFCALGLASWMFDAWIDNRRPEDRYDGDTAVWVIIGVTYTIAGWTVLLGLWRGWNMAIPGAALLLACFVASGAPMYFGEAERGRRNRNDGRHRHGSD